MEVINSDAETETETSLGLDFHKVRTTNSKYFQTTKNTVWAIKQFELRVSINGLQKDLKNKRLKTGILEQGFSDQNSRNLTAGYQINTQQKQKRSGGL